MTSRPLTRVRERADRPWRVFVDTAHAGAWNMTADVALFEAALAEDRPLLRLYAFTPATVTLGRAERPAGVLDLAACAVDGIGVAVRPTGGRAVLHDEELTYCVAAREGVGGLGDGREAPARVMSEILTQALRSLGVEAEAVRSGSAEAPRCGYRSCFASASRWEASVGGRKIVGSAQRWWRGGVLQHGSILLGPGFRRLARYLAPTGLPGSHAVGDAARAVSAAEILGRSVSRAETALAVVTAVRDRCGPPEVCEGLPASLKRAADRICAQGDSDPVWAALAPLHGRGSR